MTKGTILLRGTSAASVPKTADPRELPGIQGIQR
jgi:hypothetical protein